MSRFARSVRRMSLLCCLAALIVLVVVLCLAPRFCNLGHVEFHANVWKLAAFTFRAESRPPEESPAKRTRAKRNRERRGDL